MSDTPDLQRDFEQALQYIYAKVRDLVRAELSSTHGTVWRGGKWLGEGIWIDNSSIKVDANHRLYTTSAGTVTSVGVTSTGGIITVTGSPITGGGTITLSFANQSANTVLAGPTSGGAATPTFRALVAADIPGLDASTITTGTLSQARGGTGKDTSAATDGQLLIGKTSDHSLNLATLTAGSGISIVNGAASVTITATGSASVITTQGDLIAGNGSGVAARLPIDTTARRTLGTVNQDVEWITPADGAGWADPTTTDGDLLYRKATLATTLGIGWIGDSWCTQTPSGSTIPQLVGADLQTMFGISVVTVNEAVSGTSTSDWQPGGSNYTTAVAGFLSNNCRLVVVALGINDARVAVRNSAATYYANLLAIANDLVRLGYIVALMYPSYCVPGSNGGDQDATANTLRVAYQAKIDLIVNGFTVRQGDTTIYDYIMNDTALLSDGIHPTAGGQSTVAQVWANGLIRAVAALTQQATLQRLRLGTNLSITGGVLNASLGPQLTVAHKGDIQGYSTAAATIAASGTSGNVLTEDSTQATGWKSKPLPTIPTALSQLSDVYAHNVLDGDTLVYSAALGQWYSSSAGFGWNVVDDGSCNQVVDDSTGFSVISDPLPTIVVTDCSTGIPIVSDGTSYALANA